MRELGVSQVVVSVSKEPPLAAKEVSGTLDELSLMDLGVPRPVGARAPGRRDHEPGDADDRDRRAGAEDRRAPRLRRRRCSCSTAATRSACSAARTCSTFLASKAARLSRPRRRDGAGFETRAIHAGQDAGPGHRRGRSSRSTWPRRSPRTRSGKHRGFEYGRTGNPTRAALESCVASLEGAAHGPRVRERHGRGGRGAARARRSRATTS